ncbi:MAG: fumarate hydratase [Candidatus Omnitrophica bacterium]|nr:fumarate hydratase [Candidatus Omnitrophota bacterium]
MRTIKTDKITQAVAELCIKANTALRPDVAQALKKAYEREEVSLARRTLGNLIENAKLARKKGLAVCQDTGMAVLFIELGQDVNIKGNDLTRALNKGVRQGYKKGHLRGSVVADPLIRNNTGDNTPAIVHIDIVKGSKIKIYLMPKGFGCENVSEIKMFKPTQSEDDIIDYVVRTAARVGPNACPPFFLGIGLGGTIDKAAFLAKKALLRPIDKPNNKKHISVLEKKILTKLNKIGPGVQGFGGQHTCLGVNILTYATHIAGLPCALNINCHALRSAKCVI